MVFAFRTVSLVFSIEFLLGDEKVETIVDCVSGGGFVVGSEGRGRTVVEFLGGRRGEKIGGRARVRRFAICWRCSCKVGRVGSCWRWLVGWREERGED